MLFRYLGLGVGHAGNMPPAFLAHREHPTRDPEMEVDETDGFEQVDSEEEGSARGDERSDIGSDEDTDDD